MGANAFVSNYRSECVWTKYVTSISTLDFMNMIAWNQPRIMKKRKRERRRKGGREGEGEGGEERGEGGRKERCWLK